MIKQNSSSTPHPTIGIIGCGAIAEMYHLPALQASPRTRDGIVVVDPNQARRQQMAEQYSAKAQSEDYRSITEAVDGVIVATPPASHFEISKWFLEHGVHVLCEKPLTEDSEEAHALVASAKQHGVHLAVNQTRRFFPTYQAIRDLIAEGALGELRSITYHDGIEFDWPAASPHHFAPTAKGAWSDTGVHLLDSIVYWLNAKPTLVESLNDAQGGPEAIATVRLRHNECNIEIKVSRLGRLRNGFRIEGSAGVIEAGAEDWSQITLAKPDGSRHRIQATGPGGTRFQTYTDFARPLLDNFTDVICGSAPPTVSGESTISTIELLEQAYQEARVFPMPWNDHWRELNYVN